MAQYERIFEKPYEDGYENLPSQNTPITAQTLNDKDTAIEHIEDFLDGQEFPTVNDAVLTIQKNGADVATFSANSAANKTANITVPTALADLTDDSTHRVVTDTQINTWNDNNVSETTDNEPYVLRQGKGDMVDMELIGGSFAWNQLVQNGNFASTSGWIATRGTISASNNILEYTYSEISSGWYGNRLEVVNPISYVSTHKYFVRGEFKRTHNGECGFVVGGNAFINKTIKGDEWTEISSIITNTSTTAFLIGVGVNENSVGDKSYVRNVNIIDLTQLFGTTIADAIYAMEQATSGSGVAWFRQYFPNAYYAYDAGSIQSVCVSGRKVVGKNLLDISNLEQGGIDANGINVASTTRIRMINRIKVEPNTYYVVNAKPSGSGTASNALYYYDSNGSFISSLGWNDSLPKTFQTPVNCAQIRATFRYTDNSTVIVESFKELQIEKGSTATAYEPYEEYVYPMPNEQLRGLFTIEDGKLKANGDILESSGKLTKKFGIVDLGSLTWAVQTTSTSDKNRFRSADITSVDKKPSANNVVASILCKYKAITAENTYFLNDEGIALDTAGAVFVYDSTKDTLTAEQFKTAMSGVYLLYELATPTVITTAPFQNPQRSDASGTEEFVDYGVESSTRDVSIPVGTNSTYTTSAIIPPLEDYTDGATMLKVPISAIGTDESNNDKASQAYSQGDYFYKNGIAKAKTSIASGATFTLGTNYEIKTLAEILKALES